MVLQFYEALHTQATITAPQAESFTATPSLNTFATNTEAQMRPLTRPYLNLWEVS